MEPAVGAREFPQWRTWLCRSRGAPQRDRDNAQVCIGSPGLVCGVDDLAELARPHPWGVRVQQGIENGTRRLGGLGLARPPARSARQGLREGRVGADAREPAVRQLPQSRGYAGRSETRRFQQPEITVYGTVHDPRLPGEHVQAQPARHQATLP